QDVPPSVLSEVTTSPGRWWIGYDWRTRVPPVRRPGPGRTPPPSTVPGTLTRLPTPSTSTTICSLRNGNADGFCRQRCARVADVAPAYSAHGGLAGDRADGRNGTLGAWERDEPAATVDPKVVRAVAGGRRAIAGPGRQTDLTSV